MREQDMAAGYPSIALPYGRDDADGKHGDEPAEILSIPASDRQEADVLALVLDRLGVDGAQFEDACRRARANGTDSASELIATGAIDAKGFAQATAAALGLACRAPETPVRAMAEIGSAGSRRILRYVGAQPGVTIAPRLEDLASVADFLAAKPFLASQVEIASEADLAAARAAATENRRSETARLSLSRDRLELSARITVTGAQGFVAAAVLAGLVQALFGTGWGWSALHVATLVLYVGCISLRFMAAIDLLRARTGGLRTGPGGARAVAEAEMRHPVYSVLVALRGENADTVSALVGSLSALVWPKSRLEVFMICEADDRDTVETVRDAISGRSWFRLVEAPPTFPRTKPKALNFALPLASGEFVVLFDAEDKPSPDQLAEAWAAFRQEGADFACVQAPLVVTNCAKGWLPAHFAMEYAALFFGLLPWLGRRGMPLPLGGTSNHFRRNALLAVGGWDSHNVTEDADLGMRLARSGYRTGTISAPTFEEAPERRIDWVKQRTRWMKGYAQTYLVHMRAPHRLFREIGGRNFLVFQLLFAGMILSGILNTGVLAALTFDAVRALAFGWPAGLEGVLLYLDAAVLVFGFAVYAALVAGTCRPGRCTAVLPMLWTVPAYWLLVSLATCRAVWHLAWKPHHWEKTPHGLAARKDPPMLEQ